MTSTSGRIGTTRHLPRVVNGIGLAPTASQGTQICDLAVAVENGMSKVTMAGTGATPGTHCLPGVVQAAKGYVGIGSGEADERTQIGHAIQNVGRCRETARQEQANPKAGENAHGRYSFPKVPHTVSQR